MPGTPAPTQPRPRPLDTLAGVSLLVPAALLAWPLPSLLAWDLYPDWTAAGLVLLAALPAVALLLVRGRVALPGPSLLLATPLLAFAVAWLRASDGPGLQRAAVVYGSALIFFVGGASLSERGRAVFVRGLVALSVLFCAPALAGHLGGEPGSLGGTLGNTGALSQAALPGAAVGIGVLGRGAGRLLGLAAVALFVAHVALAPVLAGGLALAAGAFVLVLTRRRAFPAAAGFGSMLPLALLLALPLDAAPPAATGGFAVRALLWQSAPAVVFDHPLAGVGPGQFEAAYPPYRDLEEIELSTHDRLLGEEIAVEHLHADWLQGFAEWGLPGGLAWVLFLVWIGARALGGRAGLAGPAAIAVLVNALVHGPLLFNPAASSQAFALFGMLAVPPTRARSGEPRRPWLLALLALVLIGPAWRLVAHGRALAVDPAHLARYGEAIERALDALPSAQAHAVRARWLSESGRRDEAQEHWRAVLELRPHHTEALQHRGLAHAQRGDHEGARQYWQRVLDLDAAHPRVLRNLALLEHHARNPDRVLAHLERLGADGRLTDDLVTDLAAREFFALHTGPGLAILALRGDEVGAARPEQLYELGGRELEGGSEVLGNALRLTAQRAWAHEHVANGDPRQALISYRQARRHARAIGALPPTVQAEIAATEWLAGRTDEARETLAELTGSGVEWEYLAAFARVPLAELGWHVPL